MSNAMKWFTVLMLVIVFGLAAAGVASAQSADLPPDIAEPITIVEEPPLWAEENADPVIDVAVYRREGQSPYTLTPEPGIDVLCANENSIGYLKSSNEDGRAIMRVPAGHRYYCKAFDTTDPTSWIQFYQSEQPYYPVPGFDGPILGTGEYITLDIPIVGTWVMVPVLFGAP